MPFVYAAAAIIIVIAIARLSAFYLPMPGALRVVLNVVLGLIAVGIALWLIDTYIPMAGAIKGLLNVVVFLAACVGVLQAFGIWNSTVRAWHNLWHSATKPDSPPPQTPAPGVRP